MIKQIMAAMQQSSVHQQLDIGEQHADALLMALFQRANERMSRTEDRLGLMGNASLLGEVMHIEMWPASVRVGPAHVSYQTFHSLMQFVVVGDLARLGIYHEGGDDLPDKVHELVEQEHLTMERYDEDLVKLTVQSNSVMFHSWKQIYLLIRGSYNASLKFTREALEYGDLLWCDHLADKDPQPVGVAVEKAREKGFYPEDMLCESGWLQATLKGDRLVGGNYMMVSFDAFPNFPYPTHDKIDIGGLEERFSTEGYMEVEAVSYHYHETENNKVDYTRLSNGQRIDMHKVLYVQEQVPDCRMVGHSPDGGTFSNGGNPIFFADSDDRVVAFITPHTLPDMRYYV